MRFITLSALFIFASTTLAAPLDLFSRQETYSSLALRDGDADTGPAFEITARSDFDDEAWLVRRSKTVVNRNARQARKTAAKAVVAQATMGGGIPAGRAKKQELKNAAHAKHNKLKAAGVEHRKTTGLPGRNQVFTIPAGNGRPERTHTGKDVRKANFASHIKNSRGKRFGVTFGNMPHRVPGGSGTLHPIPGMVGTGHEHPLSGGTTFSQMKKDRARQPARIISQTDAAGNHRHMGVIAHDQSRPAGHLGVNDHFKINPT